MQQLGTLSVMDHTAQFCDGAYFTKNRFIEYIPGTLNVIISVPHGGYLSPKTIPNRRCPRDTRVTVKTKCDLYTIELALLLAKILTRETGRHPHVVINHLSRKKLDCNCDQPEATFGVPEAMEAWNDYHSFIDSAKQAIGGPGLFLDLHGHSHPESWVELGYTISKELLNSSQYTAADTSVHDLFRRLNATGQVEDIKQLICGPLSLGGLIEAVADMSIAVVPSPQNPSPDKGGYFRGGYNVLRHGSRFGGVIDAIQIESPVELRMPQGRSNYAEILGKSIATFLRLYYHN